MRCTFFVIRNKPVNFAAHLDAMIVVEGVVIGRGIMLHIKTSTFFFWKDSMTPYTATFVGVSGTVVLVLMLPTVLAVP